MEHLSELGPFALYIAAFVAGWKACQEYQVKPDRARMEKLETRLEAAEAADRARLERLERERWGDTNA